MTAIEVPYCWNEKQKEKKNNFSFLLSIKILVILRLIDWELKTVIKYAKMQF